MVIKEWRDNHIVVDVPKKPLKITGTRLATILGLNDWSTPFEAFCEITRTYRKPFEETIYTAAGKLIEPKQIDYLRRAYFMTDLKTPTDIYGRDYFKSTKGDFFPDEPIFGGMWDAMRYDGDKPAVVIECKSTKRSEDWLNGQIPIYYALQGALYAYLQGIDDVLMVVTFLEDKDYEIIEKYLSTKDDSSLNELVVNAENTAIRPFKISELFPNRVFCSFDDMIRSATIWWEEHVLTGVSPDYDERKDADILKELRKNTLNPTTKINELIEEYEKLEDEINRVKNSILDKEDRLEVVDSLIKQYLSTQFRDGDKQVVVKGNRIEFVLSKTCTKSIDKELLKNDGLLSRYEVVKEGVRFTKKEIGGK